jgi:urea carboxylase
MEGPGGYQLFGRTIQVWNTFRETPPFEPGHPWLLRHFDQIRFYEVSEQELLDARDAFPHGKFPLRIEAQKFSMAEYRAFCAANAEGIAAFGARQRAAFEAERLDWVARGLNTFEEKESGPAPEELALEAGEKGISSPVPGSVWQVLKAPGDKVAAGEAVMIVESMKMEVRVVSAVSGVVKAVGVGKGQVVKAGQRVGVVAV